jgi:phage gp46-like protein
MSWQYNEGDMTKNGMGYVLDTHKNTVLVRLTNNSYSKYVVWKYDDEGNTFWGHYFRDGQVASQFFTDKVIEEVLG